MALSAEDLRQRQELGQRIRRAREDAGMTQPELAAATGLGHPQSISNYERGRQEVPQKRLRMIAEATKKPLQFFIDDPDDLPVTADRLRALEDAVAQGFEEMLGAIAHIADDVEDLKRRLPSEASARRRRSRAG